MSGVLQDLALEHIRQMFTRAEVFDVLHYAGEFAADEIANTQFKCPAILVGVLGLVPAKPEDRFADADAEVAHMIAFAVSNVKDRKVRARQAQSLSEKLCQVLRRWRPNDSASPIYLAAPEKGLRAENLFGRKVDAAGMALWAVTWRQCVKARPGQGGLYDWLSLDIESTVKAAHDQAEPGPDAPPLVVTHDIKFEEDTPSTD